MEKYIENKINLEDKEKFDLILEAVSQDRIWLSLRSLNDFSPEIIKRVLYEEVVENNYPHLHGEGL